MVLAFTGGFRNAKLICDVFMTVLFHDEQVEHLSATIRQTLDLAMYDVKTYRFPPFRFLCHHLVVPVVFPLAPVKILFAMPDAFIYHDPF